MSRAYTVVATSYAKEHPNALRSQQILGRPEWSTQRAYYKAMAYSDYDLARPMIGIANS